MIEPPTNSQRKLALAQPSSNIAAHSIPIAQDPRYNQEVLPALPALPALLAQGSNLSATQLRSYTEALQAHTRKLDPTLQRIVAQIGHEAQNLTQLALGLQKLDQLQRNPTTLHFEPIEPGDLLMSILPEWKQRAPHHELELALPGEIPTILADPALAGDAMNLLIEAAVALAPTQTIIRVSIRPQLDDVLVSVQYAGVAPSSYDREHFFEPFYQPEQWQHFSVCGGIGLTLARAILLAHGGRIWMQSSQDGEYTAFVAAWPLLPAPPAPTEELIQQPQTTGSQRLAIATQRPVVLVLDTDTRMLRYLRANLEAQRYKPVLAKEVDDVFHLIELEEPDLLLLDLNSMGTRPEDTAGLFQELQAFISAPIICIAPQHNSQECARLLDLGAVDYLAKPFGLEELLARLKVALRTREATAQATQREPIFRSGDLTIDFGQRRVLVGERQIALSKTEFKLLRVLAEHAGMVLAHEVLLSRVWGVGYRDEVEFVWVYIRRLRKKIEPDPSAPTYIQTVPGVGYRLARL